MGPEDLPRDWDLIVIGGGITGAGVLREAGRMGLRVLLLEQKDYVWGTSSRSTKLVHGGFRYLKEGKIGLTRDSVKARERLLREAPGLVDKMGFPLPVYRHRGLGRWTLGTGSSGSAGWFSRGMTPAGEWKWLRTGTCGASATWSLKIRSDGQVLCREQQESPRQPAKRLTTSLRASGVVGIFMVVVYRSGRWLCDLFGLGTWPGVGDGNLLIVNQQPSIINQLAHFSHFFGLRPSGRGWTA